MTLHIVLVNLFCWTLFLLSGKIGTSFAPRVARHSTPACLHANKPEKGGADFWDERFKCDPEWKLSDRMKKRNAQEIEDQLSELNALAAKRPAIPGDYDWDEAYKDDPDWITGDDVPGKMKMTKEQMEAQERALDALAENWRSNGYETSDMPPEDIN